MIIIILVLTFLFNTAINNRQVLPSCTIIDYQSEEEVMTIKPLEDTNLLNTIKTKTAVAKVEIKEIDNSDKITQNIAIDIAPSQNINYELEDYVIGVVAGEMPISFPHEAIKAQAVAARTYALRAKINNPKIKYKDIQQAYISIDKMKKMWGNNFEANYNKIKNAVYSTGGIILKYENEPILAVFSSTTNGYTQECKNVWTQDLPYLSSVESKGDELSPYYSQSITIDKHKLKKIFKSDNIKIVKTNTAGYVEEVSIGNKTYSGDQIRTMLSLPSTSFEIVNNGNSITFNTKGYGHGVGMSQYGACYMANNGSNYIDILLHYYKGSIVTNI